MDNRRNVSCTSCHGVGKACSNKFCIPNKMISWVLEGYDVVGISGDALGIFAGCEHVLTQIHESDGLMMRMFGEHIQHMFVVSSIFHHIIRH